MASQPPPPPPPPQQQQQQQQQQPSLPLQLTPHNTTTTTQNSPQPPFTSPRPLLEYLYADLTNFHLLASPNCTLHPANKSLPPRHGLPACQAHEENLLAATRGTLKMVVEQITVSNSHEFGCVMGRFELGGGEVRETFCGVWRFEAVEDEGGGGRGRTIRVVEHWENLTPEGGKRVKAWVERGGVVGGQGELKN